MQPNETFESFKLDVIMNNEEISEMFQNVDLLKVEEFEFPHAVMTYTKDKFIFGNIKQDLDKMIETLINTNTDQGLVLILSKEYMFTAPLNNPYCFAGEEGNIPVFADPENYLGIFSLPLIETEWPEKVERDFKEFNLMDILKESSNI